MERPKIRKASADDIPELVRIQKESLADTYGHFLDADSLEPWLHGEIIEQYVAEKWPQTFVAEFLGEVVGMATLEGAVVDLLWVRGDRRNQGIGGFLMDWGERRIAARHEAAELECFVPNEGASRFYARRGYRTVRRYLDPLAGVEKAVLRKPLVG
jgi:ribosomal protein S18 acetylase RimI-like enzyme